MNALEEAKSELEELNGELEMVSGHIMELKEKVDTIWITLKPTFGQKVLLKLDTVISDTKKQDIHRIEHDDELHDMSTWKRSTHSKEGEGTRVTLSRNSEWTTIQMAQYQSKYEFLSSVLLSIRSYKEVVLDSLVEVPEFAGSHNVACPQGFGVSGEFANEPTILPLN
ncbi:hypothetical protein BYT27DRAFT_7209993 [Phlegmacium glaucopus]|nr:hypothetical protein BYT27DRAFT_7209993 [Phlegmacium glaucopus]